MFLILGFLQTLVDQLDYLNDILFFHSACRYRRRPNPHSGGNKGRLRIERNHVFVDGDISLGKGPPPLAFPSGSWSEDRST